MADRVDFYFRQRVTEAELDLACELLEQADRDLAADIGIYGIVTGAVPTQHSPVPDLTVDLTSPTRAYDRLGQRIFFGTDQTVDCSVDLVGIPTAVSGPANERWLAVLPSPYREALTLTALEGMTQKQAAEMLGVSLSGMKSRVQRGRVLLRRSLEDCCTIALDVRGRIVGCEPRPDGRLPMGCCA